MNQNKWFQTVFLPSLKDKAINNPNPKYKNSLILSLKQYEICFQNMEDRQHQGDYGIFSILHYKDENYYYQVGKYGKYYILNIESLH